MKVVFRADASVRIGTGHVVRCRTLAEALRDRGAEVSFVCRAHSGSMIEALASEAIPVTRLPAPPTPAEAGEDYAQWLGVTQAADAAQTLAALDGERPDWVVVDHYGLDAEWETALRPHVSHIMVIDDLANRPHDCDVLLDQNFSTEGDERYKDLVPGGCKLLTGPRYALLRPDYADYRKCMRARDGRITRVLVFMGGSDPDNLTGMALKALSAPELEHLKVDVVTGSSNPHADDIASLAKMRPNTTVHGPRQHLADLMAGADLAIGAGGATTWERMCLGLPSLVISLAENQLPACEALESAGLIRYAGHADRLDTRTLGALLLELAESPDQVRRLGERGRNLVDGLGAARVAEIPCPTPAERLRLRPDPASGSPSGRFLVEAEGHPIGEMRVEPQGSDEALMELDLDPLAQRRSLENELLHRAVGVLRAMKPRSVTEHDRPGIQLPASRFLRRARVAPGGGERRSIAILSDASSWINDRIPALVARWLDQGHRVLWAHEIAELSPADFCFYLSCGRIVAASVRAQFRHNLVVHESDLPRGKGWSPLTWQILEGADRIPVTLLEAADKVDSGVIYLQEWIELAGHELVDEVRVQQAEATFRLCQRFIDEFPGIVAEAREQSGEETFYPRRQPADSGLETARSLAEQFQLLRVCDNARYPAFFELEGHTYDLAITKRDP